jgi:hypothetical protein
MASWPKEIFTDLILLINRDIEVEGFHIKSFCAWSGTSYFIFKGSTLFINQFRLNKIFCTILILNHRL